MFHTWDMINMRVEVARGLRNTAFKACAICGGGGGGGFRAG